MTWDIAQFVVDLLSVLATIGNVLLHGSMRKMRAGMRKSQDELAALLRSMKGEQ